MADKTLHEKSAICGLKSPAGHWWYQRVAAVFLVPLSVWLLLFLNKALHASLAETVNWLAFPVNALASAIWIVAVFYHAALGIQVVIEDYVSSIPLRHLAIRATKLAFLGLGVAALAAIIIIL